MAEVSTVIIGMTGSGKSEGQKVEISRIRDERQYAQVIFDPQGTLATDILAQNVANGHELRTEYHELGHDDNKFLGFSFLRWSSLTGLSKEKADDITKANFKQVVMANRNLKTIVDRPWIDDWLDWALELHRWQRHCKPVHWLYFALVFDSKQHREMLADCTNEEVIEKAREMTARRRRNQEKAEAELGGARRFLKPIVHPLFLAHTDPEPYPLPRALIDKKQIIVSGKGTPVDTCRFLFLMMQLEVINSVKRHFDETGEKLPVVVTLEEAGAYGLICEFTIDCMKVQRKMGGPFMHVLSQSTLDWADQSVFDRMAANAVRKIAYRNDAPEVLKKLGGLMAATSWRDSIVHHETERQVHDGYQAIQTTSRSDASNKNERVDKYGVKLGASGGINTTTSVSESFQAKYRTVKDKHYKNPGDHLADIMAEIANNLPGQRHRADLSGVTRETVTMLGEAYQYGYVKIPVKGLPDEHLFKEGARVTRQEYHLTRAIHRIRSRSHYQLCTQETPCLNQLPTEQPSVSGPNPSNNSPLSDESVLTPTPTPATNGDGDGMLD